MPKDTDAYNKLLHTKDLIQEIMKCVDTTPQEVFVAMAKDIYKAVTKAKSRLYQDSPSQRDTSKQQANKTSVPVVYLRSKTSRRTSSFTAVNRSKITARFFKAKERSKVEEIGMRVKKKIKSVKRSAVPSPNLPPPTTKRRAEELKDSAHGEEFLKSAEELIS